MKQKGLRVEFALPGLRKRREETSAPKDPVPRIARLLALAHKWEGLVRRGEVKDYAEIARRMGLSRARVTQVCNLVLLAPEYQQQILTMSAHERRVSEAHLRTILSHPTWGQQQTTWTMLLVAAEHTQGT